MALETPEIDRYDKMLLLDDRSPTQMQVATSKRPSTLAKERRGRPISIRWGRDALAEGRGQSKKSVERPRRALATVDRPLGATRSN